ncbi:hypothetical protein TW95_gp0504 [Pandoravirus inopinatum]|uniref:Transmembrane protein n=1 Tax=Pandoravirus inopinatum TaxID=1605721 RepID=A0A0B5IX01_9VIRU|nr:hypothetical protein TW95_gp0504 [Pandoravirus inopinatum]AJF97238.1 hypothetical protein [Pandoravirus inopinatum]
MRRRSRASTSPPATPQRRHTRRAEPMSLGRIRRGESTSARISSGRLVVWSIPCIVLFSFLFRFVVTAAFVLVSLLRFFVLFSPLLGRRYNGLADEKANVQQRPPFFLLSPCLCALDEKKKEIGAVPDE